MWLWATEFGLCGAGFGAEISPADVRRLGRYGVAYPEAGSTLLLEEAGAQMTAYFDQRLRVFSLPLDLRGTAFQQAVWEMLLQVPYGETITYGEIALELGRPRSSQAVGQAVAANPVAIVVPCHRVVGRNGALTGYKTGVGHKALLLQLEHAGLQLRMPLEQDL
jgi:O-6-methylguanine DNA methyltransferase